MVRVCHGCCRSSKVHKRCAGCQNVWYCNQECQTRRSDWTNHFFFCKPRRPVSTATILAYAVREDIFPEDPQTCEDYGFTKAFTSENRTNLFGLYIALIKYFDIKPKTLHRWRMSGTLVREIKAVYEKLPEGGRGEYYPWFLRNQYVLDGSSMPYNPDIEIARAWQYFGRRVFHEEISTMSLDCFFLYHLLLDSWFPGPAIQAWVSFGFCASPSMTNGMVLSEDYDALLQRCTFAEFCAAYRSSSLLQLFHFYHIEPDTPILDDVLRDSPYIVKTVWHLKAYVDRLVGDIQEPIPAVVVDYGFTNCHEEEMTELKRVYTRYFEHQNGDPIALHKAAMENRLFQHVSTLFQLNENFQRLMQNPCPQVRYCSPLPAYNAYQFKIPRYDPDSRFRRCPPDVSARFVHVLGESLIRNTFSGLTDM